MKLISLEQLQAIATAYIDNEKIANPSWIPSKNDFTGLLEKIIKTVIVDGDYAEDLSFMDGFRIGTGEAIEEYFMGFVSPEDLDENGADNAAPKYVDMLPTTYSTRFGEKTLKVTERYSRLQNSFLNEEDFRSYVSYIVKRLYDSLALYLNDCKRQLLGVVAKRTGDAMATAPSSNAPVKRGTYVKSGNGKYGIAVKDFNWTDFNTALSAGNIVEAHVRTVLKAPTDEPTGEAFIKSVKSVVEDFRFPSQGDSMNGNIAGVAPKYILLVKKGVMPSIEVDTLAGAFHMDKLAFDVETKVVKDFGTADPTVYAILIDERAVKLHNTDRYVLNFVNADGGFINYVLHDEELGYYSPNTKIHVWATAA